MKTTDVRALLRFAIENPSVQTIGELEEMYRQQHDTEGEIDSQEFHRRIIDSINNYDEEENFSQEAEEILKNEQIEIQADLPLAQFLGELLKKRKFQTKKEEFLKVLDESSDLKEFYDALHPNVQNHIINCCDDSNTFLYHVKDVQNDRSYFKGLSKGKQKDQLVKWFEKSNWTDLEFMAQWQDMSVKEIEAILYSDKQTKRKIQMLIRKHRLASSKTPAMVHQEVTTTVTELEKISEEESEEISEEEPEEVPDETDSDPDGGYFDDWPRDDSYYQEDESSRPTVKVDEIGTPGTMTHFVMWSSNITEAYNPGDLLIDTCVVMQNPALTALANCFSRLYVSTISVYELRHLLESERSDKHDIEALVYKAFRNIADEQLKEPNHRKINLLKDDDPDLESPEEDLDIQLVHRAREKHMTFVTRDAGAAVYAKSIGVPCRFLKHKFPADVCQFKGTETYVLDTEVLDGGILTYLQKYCKHIYITSEYAKYLNRRKEASSQNENVKKMQNAIATDINGVFLMYENEFSAVGESRIDYENELITLCKNGGYTFITASIISYVWALAHGIKAQLWYHIPTTK